MPDVADAARAALSIDASEEARRRIVQQFDRLCIELISEWLTGERRFESVGQQTEYWIARLYEELYVDEQPEAARLYARFSLPLPRAQYLVRLLLARRVAQWRVAARREAELTLGRFEGPARDAIKDKAGQVQRFETSLSNGGYNELIVAYEFIVRPMADRERPTPPLKLPSSPAVIWFSITAETLVALLEHFRKEEMS
jgi:hypothetical protein